jgi:hypothetical protein
MLGFHQVQPGKFIHQKAHFFLNKVSDLINPVTGLWDDELIREIFLSVDATRILEIPIYLLMG